MNKIKINQLLIKTWIDSISNKHRNLWIFNQNLKWPIFDQNRNWLSLTLKFKLANGKNQYK